MRAKTPKAKIHHILCPSDLSHKSQKSLGFAARLAETLGASLTACHCSPANWFTEENRLPSEDQAIIKTKIRDQIAASQGESSTLTWRSLVVENSFDPAQDILTLARESDVDLIVMKARPGVLSAFRFGSIVERIVEGAPCPTLLLPSRFLADRDPKMDTFEFRRVLFDYDFSEATDQLFQVAKTLARDYHAQLQVLSVIEPLAEALVGASPFSFTQTSVQSTVRRKLNAAVYDGGGAIMEVPAVVQSGRHAEAVLEYAKMHDVDLICTALPPTHFYYEKLYSTYLGSLLKSSVCPILVKQSSAVEKVRKFQV